ncbi:hypothetical protein SEA_PHONEGINGI_13 [Microbacterium phage Phonegingi]|nr:hypothetical protein SEA_PHONEGINGI_13 [Microbacterium phage Phonegingi]
MGIGTLRRYHGAPRVDQPVAALPEAPKKGDNAETWKAYAAVRGWDATLSKAKIIEQYEADLEAQSNAGDERVVSTPTGATTETVPEGSVTPSEPQPVGEAEQRDADKPGEGVTTSADLIGGEAPTVPEGAPAPDETSPDSERAGADATKPADEAAK